MKLTVSSLLAEEAEINQANQENTKYGAQNSAYDWIDVTPVRARTENRRSWKQDK